MKKIQIMGWLVMAAAFITTFTACSSDENNEVIGGTPVEPVRTVSVTVGAGIIDDAITRSGIIDETHTLKFTEGDKLFVRAMYGGFVQDDQNNEYYEHMLRGFLTMDALQSDGSASFSGTLEQYDRAEGNSTDDYTYKPSGSITLTFTSDDPIGEAEKAFATLVHSSASLGLDYTDECLNIYYVQDKLTPDVNTLMTKYLTVSSPSGGTEYKITNSFSLSDTGITPILNCTIHGLRPGTTYTVTYDIGGEYDDVNLSPTVTTDTNGDATFAFFGDGISNSHALRFVSSSPSETITVTLGNNKVLGSKKIYNVERTVTPTLVPLTN